MDFINQYISQSQVTMITISEDKGNDTFKYRATAETTTGKKVYLVLPQVENFLLKLDAVQREMGKSPQDFAPVKYANAAEEDKGAALNWAIGAAFAAFFGAAFAAFLGAI